MESSSNLRYAATRGLLSVFASVLFVAFIKAECETSRWSGLSLSVLLSHEILREGMLGAMSGSKGRG